MGARLRRGRLGSCLIGEKRKVLEEGKNVNWEEGSKDTGAPGRLANRMKVYREPRRDVN